MAMFTLKQRGKSDTLIAEVIGGNNDNDFIFAHETTTNEKPVGMYNEIKLPDGELQPVPPISDSIGGHVFIPGSTGCGKSYFCVKYAVAYQETHPDNPVYLVSYVPEETLIKETINNIPNVVRIPIEHIVEGKVTCESIANSMIIFDDVDAIPPIADEPPGIGIKTKANSKSAAKKAFEKVMALRDQVLTLGRHFKVLGVITSHVALKGVETAKVLNEASLFVVFPKHSSAHQVESMLHKYVGLSRQQIERINSIPSRWVGVNRSGIRYVIYDKGCYIL